MQTYPCQPKSPSRIAAELSFPSGPTETDLSYCGCLNEALPAGIDTSPPAGHEIKMDLSVPETAS